MSGFVPPKVKCPECRRLMNVIGVALMGQLDPPTPPRPVWVFVCTHCIVMLMDHTIDIAYGFQLWDLQDFSGGLKLPEGFDL